MWVESPTAAGALLGTEAGGDLVVAGALAPPERAGETWVVTDDGRTAVDAVVLAGREGLGIVRLGGCGVRPDEVRALAADHDGERAVEMADGIGALLRTGLSAAPPGARRIALSFLVEHLVADERPSRDIARLLATAASILRERAPAAIIDEEHPPTAQVETLVRVDDRSYYVRGWLGPAAAHLCDVALVSPEGLRAEVPPTAYRFARPDVASFYGLGDEANELGFAALCQLGRPSLLEDGWVLDVLTRSGDWFEAECPAVVGAPAPARDVLVGDLALERLPNQALRVQHLAPAIARVQDRLRAAVTIRRVEQFEAPPVDPDVSVIVPLYHRLDLIEHQMVQFADDPEIADADLVYVLDSPEQERQLVADCERLARFYRLPFRVAVLSANGGYSTANNLGVSLARGRLVVLLNSDVVPDEPGWLGRLAAFHDGAAGVGAVGPMLVYEDESLQHAGVYFERTDGRLWFNQHYFKGLHRSFPPAGVPRRVPAVSGACLMMRADRYRQLGGLRGSFVQGDYEDTDLCLRLQEAGLDVWYAADVSLYHLEGQSYPSDVRRANDEFNRWFHTHLWDARIESVMAAQRLEDANVARR